MGSVARGCSRREGGLGPGGDCSHHLERGRSDMSVREILGDEEEDFGLQEVRDYGT